MMSAIIQPLLIPILYRGEERYQLVEPWSFTLPVDLGAGTGITVEVPLGMVVDGASVPRALWTFMPPDGLHRAAALAHDVAYETGGRLLPRVFITRAQADLMFYDLMILAGVSKWRASIAYRGVRIGGGSSWDKHAPIIQPVDGRKMMTVRLTKRNALSHIYAP